MLEEDGLCIPESPVIMELLEERFPEPPLYPADPAQRALVRLAVWRFEDEFSRDYYAARRGADGAEERFASRLAALDDRLTQTVFLAGPTYTLADIAWFPWLPRRGVPRFQPRGLPCDRRLARPARRATGDRGRDRRRRLARGVSALPSVVSVDWVAEHADDDDVLLADVRGPNAHARGHCRARSRSWSARPASSRAPTSSKRSPVRWGCDSAGTE